MTTTYDLLATSIASTNVSSFEISSIPSTHRDLIAVVNGRSSGSGGGLILRFNNDSSGNYSDVIAEAGPNAGLQSVSGSGRTQLITTWSEQELGSWNSVIIYQIFDYSQTNKHKPVLVRVNKDGSVTTMTANRWASTSAITAISFIGAFSSGSRVDIYGIRA